MTRREFLKASAVGLATATARAARGAATGSTESRPTKPIQLHPDNPHYFLWRGKPAVLITAGEHYGAVLNLDFDYTPYLKELKAHGFNLTRIFSGAYREVPGSFNITGNTLAPAGGRFACPWARVRDKFDLTKWDETYFKRLKDFIAKAGEHGVVVELVFFCTMYDDDVWGASPMNARNNVNGIGNVGKYEVYDAGDRALLDAQRAMVRKVVSELNRFDNLYYEVCNEPYERGGLTKRWNDLIVETIVEAEATLPKKHLIAQGFPSLPAAVTDLNPNVSVLNFHGAKPDSARLNYHHNKVVAFDETGGSDHSDRKYRTEGWEWIMAGGAVYDHLDFSFTTDRPDGSAVPLPPKTPGGGGPELRRQLQVLKEFIEGFDFIRMAPVSGMTKGNVSVLAETGKAYAVYVKDGRSVELPLDLPKGSYKAEWVSTKTGEVTKTETFSHAGGNRALSSPSYTEDIALRVKRTA
jgi:hypothetical protein